MAKGIASPMSCIHSVPQRGTQACSCPFAGICTERAGNTCHRDPPPSQLLLCLAVCDQSCKTCTGPTNQDCSQCEVGWERKGEACLGEVRGGQGRAGVWSVGESRGVKKGRALGALSLLHQF